MEAGLPEFLFHIDQALILQRKQPFTHPGKFATVQPRLCNIDGGSGEVGTYYVAFGCRGIVIPSHQVPLIFHCAYRGADDELSVELGIMGAREVGEKRSGPWAAVSAILGKGGIDGER